MKNIQNTRRLSASAAAAVLALFACSQVSAQLPPPVQPAARGDANEFEAADALLTAGKYREAMEAFEKFQAKYKGFSPKSLDVTFRLAVCYMKLEKPMFDDAVRELGGLIKNPRVVPAAKELAQLYIAKALTMKALQLSSATDAQKAAFVKALGDAVVQYDVFLATYPKAKDTDSALFLSAQLLVVMENFDEGVKRLTSLVQRFPQSPFVWDAQMWIGKAWFIAGNQLLHPVEKGKAREPKPDEIQKAEGFYKRAQPVLGEVYSRSGDVALANDAVFFIAQMQISRANLIEIKGEDDPKKKDRDALLNASLDAFRAVRSVEEVVEQQEAKIKRYQDAKRLIPPATPNYAASVNRIDGLINIEEDKVANFKKAQDMYLVARISIARIFMFLKKPDEARALLRYLSGQKDLWEAEKKKDEKAARESEASVAVLLCLTYTESRNVAKSLETYEAFRASFKGHPAGENLPLLVANVVADSGQPDKAEEILQQGAEDYPEWRFAGDAVSVRINIAVKRGDFETATKLVDEVLAKNPKPGVELKMQFLKATILQAQAREKGDAALAEKAIEAYTVVTTKAPGSSEAEEAQFNICEIKAGKSPASAIEPLKAFISSYSAGGKSASTAKNVQTAQYRLAQVLDQSGKGDLAITEYRKLIENWPASEPALGAYFKIFDIYGNRKDYASALKTMKDFREKHPTHENVYYTFNNEAEIVLSGNLDTKLGPDGKPRVTNANAIANTEKGAKVLLEFVDYEIAKDLKPRRGEGSLIKVADKWIEQIKKLPAFITMNADQKVIWNKSVDGVIGAVEKQLQIYPEGDRLGEALERLLSIQDLRVKAQQVKANEVEDYFNGLSTKYAKTAAVKAKIQFAVAAFLAARDPEAAERLREKAFKDVPEPLTKEVNGVKVIAVTATPNDYDGYLGGLFDRKRSDDITKFIARIRTEYPGVEGKPNAVVDNAQAVALFWEAKLLGDQGKVTDAGQKYAELRAKYPSSTKVLEADYGEILGKFEQTKKAEDDYIPRLTKVVNKVSDVKNFELPAKALFLIARIHESRADYDNAIDTYIKIHTRYASVPKIAGDGLWAGAQLLERQARGEIPVMTKLEKKAAMEEVARKGKAAEEKKKAADEKKKTPDDKKPAATKPADKTTANTKPGVDARPAGAAAAAGGAEKK